MLLAWLRTGCVCDRTQPQPRRHCISPGSEVAQRPGWASRAWVRGLCNGGVAVPTAGKLRKAVDCRRDETGRDASLT